ncbi:Transcriptional regulator KdgR [Anaerolineales bacterium]|nr:Transcriptional regulator KdgR [Anaerolineales bacterium]
MSFAEHPPASSEERAVDQADHPKLGNGTLRATMSSTVAKAIGIVDILASRGEAGINLTELSILLEMPKSSTHRYIVTLQELGLAERKDGDRYCLGTKVIELAGSFLTKSDLRNESQAIMDELAEKTGETVHLAVPSGTEVVYIAKIESRHALIMSSHIGSRLPMYCTSLGKAILAFSKPKLVRSILAGELRARTPHTITSIEALRAELLKVRSQGFALDKQENELGICCIGAPVLDYSSTAIAAISISGPCDRISPGRAVELGHLLCENTQRISRRWGFSGTLPGPNAGEGTW